MALIVLIPLALVGALIVLLYSYNKRGERLADLERFRASWGNVPDRAAHAYAIEVRIHALQQAEQGFGARLAYLQREVGGLEDQAEAHSFGFYKSSYNFGSAEEYKRRLDQVREHQRAMIKSGNAAVCTTQWTVSGSARAGQKMTNDFLKLMLRAFNGECDTAVLSAKYNNVVALEKRIRADFESLNKLGLTQYCQITQPFLALKLQELHLVHEYQEKRQAEQEEQRRIREQMREDERAQREIDRAREEADKEAQRYTSALERARAEMEEASGRARMALEAKARELEEKLAMAQQKQRAVAQAQITTAGHVYVISNVGSFGEDVYKIGMTRRLDPQDRVDELGDASVPFTFDVHAMIYTKNAPGLERQLHQMFHTRRVNRVNERKEFFRVSLDEVHEALHALHRNVPPSERPKLEITRVAQAEEYRKTMALVEEEQRAAQPIAQAS